MDNILAAMKGHHLFDRFGFNLPTEQTKINSQYSILNNFKEWNFEPKLSDWINVNTGERMSNYVVPFELEQLLTSCINKELE